MFAAQSFNQDIGDWDVSNGQNLQYMFRSARDLIKILVVGMTVGAGGYDRMFYLAEASFNQNSLVVGMYHPSFGFRVRY